MYYLKKEGINDGMSKTDIRIVCILRLLNPMSYKYETQTNLISGMLTTAYLVDQSNLSFRSFIIQKTNQILKV